MRMPKKKMNSNADPTHLTKTAEKLLLRCNDLKVQLEAETERSERFQQALREFLVESQHEIRTPLNGIIGYAQLLLQDSTLTETQRHRVLMVLDSGQRLLGHFNRECFAVRRRVTPCEAGVEEAEFVVSFPPAGERPKIMIVDESWETRSRFFRILTRYDFQVRQAKTGKDALEVWIGWHPDCMYINPEVRAVSGLELVRLIREVERNPVGIQETLQPLVQKDEKKRTVCVALAAAGQPGDKEWIKRGFQGRLDPDFESQDLLMTLSHHVPFTFTPIVALPPIEEKNTLIKAFQGVPLVQRNEFYSSLNIGDFEACRLWADQNLGQDSTAHSCCLEYIRRFDFDFLQGVLDFCGVG